MLYREESNFCVSCGAEIPEGSMVCRNCLEDAGKTQEKKKSGRPSVRHPGYLVKERRKRW